MMDVDNPKLIPETRVALLFEVYEPDLDSVSSEAPESKRRDLRKAIRKEAWFQD